MMWRSFSLTLVCSLFLALCAPLTARACDTTQTATDASTCVTMAHRGRPGVWFELATADQLRKATLEVPQLKLQIGNLESLEKKSDREIQDLRGSLQLRKEAIESLKSSIGAHVRQAREARQEAAQARAELDRWYRSPVVLIGAGVVMTVSIGTLAVLFVNK